MLMTSCYSFSLSCQTHLDARTFRGRVFENYDQFCIIFGHFYEPLHWDESGTCDEPVEALSVYPVNYDISVGRHIRWTSDMDSCLTAILVQQIKQGNRSKFDYTLRPDAFEASVLAINEKFQLYLTKEHVKNRLRTWKKQYAILKELMTQSGFEWDEKRKMVIANDSVWTEYIKVHINLLLTSVWHLSLHNDIIQQLIISIPFWCRKILMLEFLKDELSETTMNCA